MLRIAALTVGMGQRRLMSLSLPGLTQASLPSRVSGLVPMMRAEPLGPEQGARVRGGAGLAGVPGGRGPVL